LSNEKKVKKKAMGSLCLSVNVVEKPSIIGKEGEILTEGNASTSFGLVQGREKRTEVKWRWDVFMVSLLVLGDPV